VKEDAAKAEAGEGQHLDILGSAGVEVVSVTIVAGWARSREPIHVSQQFARQMCTTRSETSSSAVSRIRGNEDANVLSRKVRRCHVAQIDMTQDG
jgi:hypothetical protein